MLKCLRQVGMIVVLACAAPLGAQPPYPPSLNQPCPASTCGGDCMNTPFEPTDCMTTPYGPARANVVIGNPLESPNMLWCPGGRPYALCFFSGPPYATGKPPAPGQPPNNVLPCVFDEQKGVANCSCQVYNSGSYYVDINSILNRGVWYETRFVCGIDGSRCKNMRDCDSAGQTKAGSPVGCSLLVAPVCNYINSQGFEEPSWWFYPQAGTADLVSTFSFAMSPTATGGPYVLGTTSCTGQYAGCMTAPCKYPPGVKSLNDGDVVQCTCPVWTGAYQVGQNCQDCSLGSSGGNSYVWSAANSIVETCTGTSSTTSGHCSNAAK
jgi:hypothetical protein